MIIFQLQHVKEGYSSFQHKCTKDFSNETVKPNAKYLIQNEYSGQTKFEICSLLKLIQ